MSDPAHSHVQQEGGLWRRLVEGQLARAQRWSERAEQSAEQTAAAVESLTRLGVDAWSLGLRAARHWREIGLSAARRTLLFGADR